MAEAVLQARTTVSISLPFSIIGSIVFISHRGQATSWTSYSNANSSQSVSLWKQQGRDPHARTFCCPAMYKMKHIWEDIRFHHVLETLGEVYRMPRPPPLPLSRATTRQKQLIHRECMYHSKARCVCSINVINSNFARTLLTFRLGRPSGTTNACEQL